MTTLNIILWSTSLSLAAIGITFGIIASINSAKANFKLQEIITSTFASEEARRLFFENIKKVVLANKKTLRGLKSTPKLSFLKYSSLSAESRLIPISFNALKIITETEFKDIGLEYKTIKDDLDESWFNIIEDPKKLISEDIIGINIKKSLIKYHETVVITCTAILKKYAAIISKYDEASKTN